MQGSLFSRVQYAGCKYCNFENQVRVPLIVRVPWITQSHGKHSDALIELVWGAGQKAVQAWARSSRVGKPVRHSAWAQAASPRR